MEQILVFIIETKAVYFSYSFVVLDTHSFQIGTAVVQAFYHFGNCLGSILGQLLVDYTFIGNDLVYLFYISWGFTTLGLFSFFILPPPK